MAYGTVQADVIGTSVAGSNLGAGNSSLMKNRIINGAMVIDQRNGGASVVAGGANYTLDRWNVYNQTDGAWTVQQVSTAPVGFVNSAKITITTADTSLATPQYSYFRQCIEGYNVADLGWGTANAKTVTLSFWAQSSLTGTFSGAISNDAYTTGYPFTYTINAANTWEYKTVTVTGAPTGTWSTNNSGSLQLTFSIGTGTTQSGTAGVWGTTQGYIGATGATQLIGTLGATFYITGVQLEVGSSATGFEYVNYQTSLANCQRYYTKLTAGGSYTAYGTAACTSSTTGNVCINWPVSMRATPTMDWANCGINNPSQISLTSTTAPTSLNAGSNSGFCSFTTAGGLTTNGAAMFNADNNASSYVAVTAEL